MSLRGRRGVINESNYDILTDAAVLVKAIRNKNLPKEAYATFMSSLKDINSDHYATQVIKELMIQLISY